MHRSVQATLVALCALLFGATAALYAQAAGRYLLMVSDSQGNRLEGVKVTVTCDALSTFHNEQTTNKKGQVTFAFTDATLFYEVKLEKEGHQTLEMRIKPEFKRTKKEEVVLPLQGELVAQPGSTGDFVRYTPAETVFNEGVEAFRAGDLETATASFLEAIARDADMTAAHVALAGAYLEKNQYDAAIASAQRAVELEPASAPGYRILYLAHEALDHDREAAAALKQLKSLDTGGNTVAMLYNEGVDALRLGDLDSAEQRFREALELDPSLAVAHSSLALIHRDRKEWNEAAASAERALAVDPGNGGALQIRYEAYKALGNAEKESEALAALSAANPAALAPQLFDQGVARFEAGDLLEAARLFEQAIEVMPDHARAHYRLGLCYASMSRLAEAKKQLGRFLELAPDDPEAPGAKEMIGYLQ